MNFRRLPVAVLLLLALVACADMKAMMSLSEALQAQYHVPANVRMNNGSHLIISFQNLDQSMKWDSGGRAIFAHDVAVFSKQHYAPISSVTDISVAFINVSQMGPLTTTRSDAPYTFGVDSLK